MFNTAEPATDTPVTISFELRNLGDALKAKQKYLKGEGTRHSAGIVIRALIAGIPAGPEFSYFVRKRLESEKEERRTGVRMKAKSLSFEVRELYQELSDKESFLLTEGIRASTGAIIRALIESVPANLEFADLAMKRDQKEKDERKENNSGRPRSAKPERNAAKRN